MREQPQDIFQAFTYVFCRIVIVLAILRLIGEASPYFYAAIAAVKAYIPK